MFRIMSATLVMALSVCASAVAAEYQVIAAGGGDYTTIQACANDLSSGDVCVVHEGTYSENVTLPDTNNAAYDSFVIRANSGDSVTLYSTTSPVVTWAGRDGWTIDGINVTYGGTESSPSAILNANCTPADYAKIVNLTATIEGGAGENGSVIQFVCGEHVVIRNVAMVVSAFEGSGVGVNGCNLLFTSFVTFSHNTVYGAASETTGKLNDGCVFSGQSIRVDRNYLRDGWAYDRHPDGIVVQGDGDRDGGITQHVSITNNYIADFSAGVFLDAFNGEIGGAVSVARNVIVENSNYRYGGQADKMNGLFMYGNSEVWSLQITNNVLSNRQQRLGIDGQDAASVIVVSSNIFVAPGFGTVDIEGTDGVVMNYNVYLGAHATPIDWGGSNAVSLADLQGTYGQDVNGISLLDAGLNDPNDPIGTDGVPWSRDDGLRMSSGSVLCTGGYLGDAPGAYPCSVGFVKGP